MCALCGCSAGTSVLLQTDHTHHERDVVDLGAWELEGLVIGVVAEDGERFVGGALLHALDERPLLGVEHIDLVPLEEGVQRHTLAGHDVAAVVLGLFLSMQRYKF